jgi:hypothetical protein
MPKSVAAPGAASYDCFPDRSLVASFSHNRRGSTKARRNNEARESAELASKEEKCKSLEIAGSRLIVIEDYKTKVQSKAGFRYRSWSGRGNMKMPGEGAVHRETRQLKLLVNRRKSEVANDRDVGIAR